MASRNDPSKVPSTTSFAYDVMLPRWKKIDTVLGGTEAMRAAGKAFTPQHPAESDDAFLERLHRNVLFNMTEITLDFLVGEPFSDPVEKSEDLPEELMPLLDDVDLQGNNIDVFARNWFRNGVAKGFGAVLVEFPRTNEMPDRTVADDLREMVRPYWVQIPPENIIFASATKVDGREVLTHVRLREEVVEQVGFAEVSQVRIRVFDLVDAGQPVAIPSQLLNNGLQDVDVSTVDDSGVAIVAFTQAKVQVSIYKEDVTKQEDSEERWVLEDVFFMDINRIPLAVFYAERDGLLLAKPPLLDLADLNIAHWQSSSDQIMVLTVARFPILASSGSIDDQKVTVGPHNWLNVKDPQGRWYYVEHTGASIESGRKDLADREAQMSEYGAQFLKRRPGNMTATQRALDSSEATSPLQDMAMRFNDAMNVAWEFNMLWLRRAELENGSISVSTDFGDEGALQSDLAELGNARRNRDLSRPKYLSELERRGVLADDFDQESNDAELEEERNEFSDGAARSDIDTQGGEQPPEVPEPPDDPVGGGDGG